MSKLFAIYEDDLAELERALPDMADRLKGKMDNRLRTQIRRLQAIMTNVRWGYGPPSHVEKVEPSDDESSAL